MSIDLSGLRNFNEILSANQLNSNARVQIDANEGVIGGFRIKQIPLNARAHDLNRNVRYHFADSLMRAFDVKTLDALPKPVRDALKIEDFKVRNGEVASSRPLTMRRISAVMDAVKEVAVRAASPRNAEAIRQNFAAYLNGTDNYLTAALDRVAVAEGRLPLSLDSALVKSTSFDVPLSALKAYTKGIKPADLAGKLDEIKAKIEADLSLAVTTLTRLRAGEAVQPDATAATALRRYFAFCALASGETNQLSSRTLSVPDAGGKIAAFLNASEGRTAGAVHTQADPRLAGSYDVTRFSADIGFPLKAKTAAPNVTVIRAYEHLLRQPGVSPILNQEAGSKMSVARMVANVHAELNRLTNDYSAKLDAARKANPDLADETNLNKLPEPYNRELSANFALRSRLFEFLGELSGTYPHLAANHAVRYADEVILSADQIPAGAIGLVGSGEVRAAAADPVQGEQALYRDLTLDKLMDDLKDLWPGATPEELRKYVIDDCILTLPKDRVPAEMRERFYYNRASKDDYAAAEALLRQSAPRELYVLKLCSLCRAQQAATLLEAKKLVPAGTVLLYHELMKGSVPLNTPIELLKTVIYTAEGMQTAHSHLFGCAEDEPETAYYRRSGQPYEYVSPGGIRMTFPAGIFVKATPGAVPPAESLLTAGDDGSFRLDIESFERDGHSFLADHVKDGNAKKMVAHVFLTRAWGFNTLDMGEILKFVKDCGYDPATIQPQEIQKLMTLARLRDFKLDDLPAFYARVLHKEVKDITEADLLKLYNLAQKNQLLDPLDSLKQTTRTADIANLFIGKKLPSASKLSGKDMLQVIETLRGFVREGGDQEAVLTLNGKQVRFHQLSHGLLQVTVGGVTVTAGQSAEGLVNIFEEDVTAHVSRFGTDAVLKMLPELTMEELVGPGAKTRLRESCLRILADRLDLPPSAFATIPTARLRTLAVNALNGHYTTETGGVSKPAAMYTLSSNTRNDVFTGEEVQELHAAMNQMEAGRLNQKVKMAQPSPEELAAKKKAESEAARTRLTGEKNLENLKQARNLFANLILNEDIVSYDTAVRSSAPGQRIVRVLKENLETFVDILMFPKEMLAGLPKPIAGEVTALIEGLVQDLPMPEDLSTFAKRAGFRAAVNLALEAAAVPPEARAEKITSGIAKSFVLKNAMAQAGLDAGSAEVQGIFQGLIDRLLSFETTIDSVVSEAMNEIQNVVNNALQANWSRAGASGAGEQELQTAEIWKKSFSELADTAMANSTSGFGGFMNNVLMTYFSNASPQEGRQMLAALFRYTDATSTDGQILGALFKGAGPLLQKMLQALPPDALGDDMLDALKDMKSNLQPIPETIVKAHLLDIVERSNGKITSIEVKRSLGAASVGQAFLCVIHTPDNPEGEECVIKILRPNIKTIIETEKARFVAAAKATPGMEKTFEGQYARILEELDFTKEKTNINYGRNVYEKPVMLYTEGVVNTTTKRVVMDKLHSMELHPLVPPSMDCLILKKAPGETYDRYMDKVRGEVRDIVGKGGFKDPATLAAARDKLVLLYNGAKQRQQFLLDLTERWVQEALYGNGFYHGDLHAGNIMTDGEGLTVIDFGNATHLTQDERTNVLRMMAAAMFGREGYFESAFLELISPEGRAKYLEKNATDKITRDLHEILNKGTTQHAGERIFSALLYLQNNAIEIPGPIYNFAQCQMRLGGAVEEMSKLMQTIERGIEQLALEPFAKDEVQTIPRDAEHVDTYSRALFDDFRALVNHEEGLSYKALADRFLYLDVKQMNWTAYEKETRPQIIAGVTDLLANGSANLLESSVLPLIRRLAETKEHSYSFSTQVSTITTEAGDAVKTLLQEFLEARAEALVSDTPEAKAKLEAIAKRLAESVVDATRSYVMAVYSGGPERNSPPEDGAFVFAIANVVTTNLQPALKSLGTGMSVQIYRDMVREQEIGDKRESRLRRAPNRANAYVNTFAQGKISAETIKTIDRISQEFQIPLDMPALDGSAKALKSVASRARLLDVLNFNLTLLQDALREEGLVTGRTPEEMKTHLTKLAVIFFVARIGGIDEAVGKLKPQDYEALLEQAGSLPDQAAAKQVQDALAYLRDPIKKGQRTLDPPARSAAAKSDARPAGAPVQPPSAPVAPAQAPVAPAPVENLPAGNEPVAPQPPAEERFFDREAFDPAYQAHAETELDNLLGQILQEERLAQFDNPENGNP